MLCIKSSFHDFSGGPVVTTLCFCCRGADSVPGWGTRMPHALRPGQKNEKGESSFHLPVSFVSYIEEMLRFGNVNDWLYYHGTWWSCWILRIGKSGGKDGKNSRLLEKPYSRDIKEDWGKESSDIFSDICPGLCLSRGDRFRECPEKGKSKSEWLFSQLWMRKRFDLRPRVELGGEKEMGRRESAVAERALVWLCGG